MNNMTEGLLAAGEWHSSANFSESVETLFGNAENYEGRFLERWKERPADLSASASAVGYTLMRAVQEAFADCNIVDEPLDMLLNRTSSSLCNDDNFVCPNDSMYERIRKKLETKRFSTIFGDVQFDEFHQNFAKTSVTMQVFNGSLSVVLPVRLANSTIHFPARNPYKLPKCPKGTFDNGNDFELCEDCPIGTFNNQSGAEKCTDCRPGDYQDTPGQAMCKECPKYAQTPDGATAIEQCICGLQFFTKERMNGTECKKCPVGGNCTGGVELPHPEPGFWADVTANDPEFAAEMYECKIKAACKGGKESECKQGYSGR